MQAQPENPAEEIERLRRCVDDLGSLLAQRTAELAAADEALKQEAAGRSRSEAALRLHELDFLAEGQRLSSTGSFSWRVDTDEIKFSVELPRIFGLEQDAPVTFELIASRVHPEDIALLTEKIEHARAGGSDLEYDIRLRMPDGSIRYVRTIARGTKHPDGQLEYVGAVQDMTQRRLADEALAETRSELAHVARVTNLGVLTASIAHELKQPLAAIVTNGETSLRWLARAQPNVEKARELTRRVVADSRRASEIINRIRDMAARRAPEQTPVSLDEVVRESMVFLREELQARKVAVALDLAPSLPLVVGDRTQLQQVVVNLAINAAQAMAQAGAARRSILIRTMLAGPETVCCTVEDSGPGIEPENIPRLFDAFFTTKDNGMGMGLPISRSIIEALGGRISADNDSALGGARFSVALPGHLTAEPAHR
jgi:C4-dicarboxylate-specific signal transduction histidine kinase